MHTLTIVPKKAPKEYPDLPVKGMVEETARVIPKRGDPFYLCNPMDEIIDAVESGESFVANLVIGMQPKRIIIQPGTIARIEEV